MPDHDVEKRVVFAVLEDDLGREKLKRVAQTHLQGWELHVVKAASSSHLLTASRRLKRDLDASGGTLVPDSLSEFTRITTEMLPSPMNWDRAMVVSPAPVPLDLVVDRQGAWGERAIFSHVLVSDERDFDVVARCASDSKTATTRQVSSGMSDGHGQVGAAP